MINRQQGRLEEAEANFRQVLEYRTEETVNRKFDFSQDYEVINLLGVTIIDRALRIPIPARAGERSARLKEAIEVFQRTLALDEENVEAHYNLMGIYGQLDNWGKAAEHKALHEKYKTDDTARGEAVGLARKKYPAADFASEALVIYDLQRQEKAAATVSAEQPIRSGVDGGAQ